MGISTGGDIRSRDDGRTVGDGRPIGTALDDDMRPGRDATLRYQRMADHDRGMGGESLADFLGWFSIGLGLAEVLAPGPVARLVGVRDPDDTVHRTVQLMGLREIANGFAVLSNQQPTRSMWSRVAGDALDLALIGRTLANPRNSRARATFAAANVLAVGALDVVAARKLSQQPRTRTVARAADGLVTTRRSVTVGRPLAEVYAFWRDFQNFPRFMRHLESVVKLDDRRSRWVANAPAGRTVEWEAEITEEREDELLAWRSLPGADVRNGGTVQFRRAPGDRGTEVRVELVYDPPLGKLGSKVAMMFREEPGQQVQDDLRHFKQVMETGEIVLSDATKQRGAHPAQPTDTPVQL